MLRAEIELTTVVGAVPAPIAPGSCLGFPLVVRSYRDVLAVPRPLHNSFYFSPTTSVASNYSRLSRAPVAADRYACHRYATFVSSA
ncbi:hypothetical protein RSOLAG1IB_05050 [Rhizoctonia solani AG-1 IB]|uniref:Uncharacterized protein n=1 Tax=Thanatephorus cucumeris (strain AG1-IB / isolate 7/3/14) TaxID=1108050 RepID=A0A0B7G0R3_THACB|nr:hypothetical protein RSOLAG1IB_05050 [Rhizoctonia solani AG-1 IB]